MSVHPEQPVGDAEREEALQRLAELHREGLLGSHDFEDRRGRARDATTRGELEELFRDLPASGAAGVARAPQASVPVTPAPATWFTKPRRDALSWIIVLGAVFLFFRTGSWLWFLLIPASAALWQLLSGREDG
jgi:hypothetical protein